MEHRYVGNSITALFTRPWNANCFVEMFECLNEKFSHHTMYVVKALALCCQGHFLKLSRPFVNVVKTLLGVGRDACTLYLALKVDKIQLMKCVRSGHQSAPFQIALFY